MGWDLSYLLGLISRSPCNDKAIAKRIVNIAPNYSITFHKVESAQFKIKAGWKIEPYDTPISSLLEQNSVKDIAQQEDQKFLKFVVDFEG
jgi:hypothetical protein